MRGTRWGRRQHWALVLLLAGMAGVAGAIELGPVGSVAAVVVMAVAW